MPPNSDRPTDEQTDENHQLSESVADVAPPAESIHDFPTWAGTVDVFLPDDVARAVAHRAGARAHREGAITECEVHDLAYDHAQVWARFLAEPDTLEPAVPLSDWVADQGVPVDHGRDPVVFPDRRVFEATAQYRPGHQIPLRVTLDVPDGVLDDAGGWAELTDSVRLLRRQTATVNR